MEIVQLTTIDDGDDSKIQLDVNALFKVFRDSNCADLPVAVYSVAGPFRTGKSFLLDLFVQQIHKQVYNQSTTEVGSLFPWSKGIRACTRGIFILSKPIILQLNQSKVAFFLMDTQGLFDLKTSTHNSNIIGTLSLLLSSFQCFNVQKRIESHHLEHIYTFAELAHKFNRADPSSEIFQKNSLLFVLRDFDLMESSFPPGFQGGDMYLNKLFSNQQTVAAEHVLMKDYLQHTFGQMRGYVLPHPGSAVKNQPCLWSSLNSKFQNGIVELSQKLFFSNSLTLRRINGRSVTCSQLSNFMESVSVHLQNGKIENILSFIEADVEAQMSNLVGECANNFLLQYERDCKTCSTEYDKKLLLDNLAQAAIERYDQSKKRGDENKVIQWRNELQNLLQQTKTAMKKCANAELEYLKNLEVFNQWLTTASNGCQNGEGIPMSNVQYQKSIALKEFKSSVAPEIADECGKYFERGINKLVTSTQQEIKNFFDGINRKRNWPKIAFYTLMTLRGLAMMVKGLLTADYSWFEEGFKSFPIRKNRRFTRATTDVLMTQTNAETDLSLGKFVNGQPKLQLNLCFGSVSYPLQSKF